MQDSSCAILIGHHIVEQPGNAGSFPLAMDYSNIRTGHFGLSYVGHVKFFPVESESKFKNSYCLT